MRGLLGGLLVASAAVAVPSAGQVPTIQGAICLDLSPVTFPTWEDHPADSLYYQVPPRVRLRQDSTEASGRLDVPEGSLPPPHEWNEWRVENDAVHLFWSTGFFGVHARFVPGDALWRGEANPFTDVVGIPLPTDSITAIPVSCDAPPKHPASEMRRLLRSVRLTSGRDLVLGEAVSEGIPLRRETPREVVLARPSGWASGAESIELERSASRIVKGIVLRFPVGADADALASVLAARIGPWTSDYQESGVSRSWAWDARAEKLFLLETSRGILLRIEDPRISWRN